MNFYKMARPAHGIFLRLSSGVGGWFRRPYVFEAYYDLAKYEAGADQDLDIIKINGKFVSGLYTRRINSRAVKLIKNK